MKKLTKLFGAALLSAALLVLAGCTPTTSTNPGNGGGSGGSGTSGNDSGNVTTDVVGPEQPAITLTGTETSVEFASKMTVGWNLGNAFDASSCDDWAYTTGLAMEYSWLPHKQATSQNLIKAVKKAGFNTIRIPISWHNHMSKNTTTYQIDSAWMNRVKTVVDWAIAEDMFVIINIHHDNLTETEIASNPGFCISTDESIQTKSEAFIEKVWTQIATTFKDYDNRLVFEVLNEPRYVGESYEWGPSASQASSANNIITAYEQKGLNAIRSSGGNNATRFVMAPGYAASTAYLSSYTLPTDTANDKLLLSTHAYTPSDFALGGDKTDYDYSIEDSINYVFNNLKSDYINNGTGVVMGEASASDKENTASRVKWADFYFKKAKATGIPVVLWDNEIIVAELNTEAKAKYDAGENGENHGYFNRATCKQYFPAVLDAIMKAVYGSSYTPASGNGNEDPAPDTTQTIAFTINYTGKDGEAKFTVGDDWTSITIEVEEVKEGMQFAVTSDALKEDHGTWKEYYADYVAAAKTNTIVIATELSAIKSANASPVNPITKIATVGIQNTKDSANTFKIVKAVVTKSDNTTENVVPVGDGWNATVSQ